MTAIFLFRFVVVIHMLVCIGNVTCFFLLPFVEPPWIALPCCTLIFFLTFQKEVTCPMTRFENKLRRQLGMREIRGFIGHYMIWPIKRRIRDRKRAKLYPPIKATMFQGLQLNSSSSSSSSL